MESQGRVRWAVCLAALAFLAGMALRTAPSPTAQRGVLETLDVALTTHAICWGPLLLIGGMGLLVASIQLFFYVQERLARLHLRQAEVARAQLDVTLAQMQIRDPRVLTDAAGRKVLVNPALTTRAVTHIDAEADPDSEQLRAALALARAMEHGERGGRAAAGAPDLALALGARMLPPAERVPPTVRILDADEAQALPGQ